MWTFPNSTINLHQISQNPSKQSKINKNHWKKTQFIENYIKINKFQTRKKASQVKCNLLRLERYFCWWFLLPNMWRIFGFLWIGFCCRICGLFFWLILLGVINCGFSCRAFLDFGELFCFYQKVDVQVKSKTE